MHRSGLGLGAGDLMWWPASTYDATEIAPPPPVLPPARASAAPTPTTTCCTRRRRSHREVSGQSWEDFVSYPHPDKGRHDRKQRPSLRPRRGGTSRRRTRPWTARSCPIKPFDTRQHESCRRHQLERAGHGEVAVVLLARGRLRGRHRGSSPDATSRQMTSIVTPIPVARSAAGAAGAAAPIRRLRARPRRARLPRPQGAACTPAGCPATCRASA